MNFQHQMAEFAPGTDREHNEKRVIEGYIKNFPHNILLRDNEFAHITSSGFIMNEKLSRVLMIHHNIYNTWAWTGGHADGDTDLQEIAIKEAREETGVQRIVPLMQKVAALNIIPVFGHFKKGKYVCSHLHLNSTYILIADEHEELIINENENSGVRWIAIEDLDKYCNEPYLVEIYNDLIKKAEIYKSNIQEL